MQTVLLTLADRLARIIDQISSIFRSEAVNPGFAEEQSNAAYHVLVGPA